MQNVSQEQAADHMPLAQAETTRFWRDSRFGGMECLAATFLTHEFAPHAHDTFSIGAIERGAQVATIRGLRESSGPGDIYLINPGEIHDGAPGDGGYRYRMIYPDVALFREILEDVTGKSFEGTPAFGIQLLHDQALADAFHAAHRTLEEGSGALETSQAMFLVLDAVFRRHGSSIIVPVDTTERTAVREARDYLVENFASDVGLEELATVAGLSRAHLIRAFRKEFHITPHSFLTDIRIRAARKRLRDGGQPAEIAFECGFADQAHFTRHFKARTGLTPGQYRAR
ncbi:AraC family transcriptional regulator [Neorhizobium galegae]|uniref:AraC family transcriptional regulator n=1 Tax=Neorhizobium galegae TaxID=399 RepID=UPI00062270E9|nr:AraC family transcriptional regulator [Neorhizobium galegae]CDZ30805.1 L-rhamnose operon transcriptional activator RhaR [Neorhizobium galegae bv. officinalis]KAA9387975.1 AraC family transcriptional regulator [Neorhizobium galegae]KAB1115563.1 AraC family transcriptional regulator [Neorhizobium galegae]MCM2499610.1 AraC family transcriptional regulator [Neorhizobium galegae]MCQ1773468.1 AraC family transcriptional regulator [Neorhizobium galegae]